jgi:hypothetical protein
MDNIETYYIFYRQKKTKMNKVLFDLKNSIFEAMYNHYTNQ